MNQPLAPGSELSTIPADLLAVDAAEMRALGYRVVDQVVEQIAARGDGSAVRTGDPAELRAALGGPVPVTPGDPLSAMQDLVDIALTHTQHTDHARYFARVPGPATFPAVLGDRLATGFQAFAGCWVGGSGPTTVEIVVLDWLRQLLGLPDGTQGILLSGGSMANMTGLIAVRAVLGDGVMYLSDQTHSSISRGLRALGLPPEHVRALATGEDLRLDAGAADPQKWSFQPYDIGALLVRRPGVLDQAFSMNPEYLIDVTSAGASDIAADFGEVDLRNRGLELSRRSRALKLWLTLRTYGTDTLARAIERGIALADHAASLLRANRRWQVVTAAQLGIVTFARRGTADGDHARAVADLTTDGYATLSTTMLHGRSRLRLCTINPATTEADLRGTIERLAMSLAG